MEGKVRGFKTLSLFICCIAASYFGYHVGLVPGLLFRVAAGFFGFIAGITFLLMVLQFINKNKRGK